MLRQTKTPTTASHDLELSHRHQGWKQGGDEGADERNVVEREGDHAPFEGKGNPALQANAPTRTPVATLISVRTSIYLRIFTAVAALPCRRIRAVSGWR